MWVSRSAVLHGPELVQCSVVVSMDRQIHVCPGIVSEIFEAPDRITPGLKGFGKARVVLNPIALETWIHTPPDHTDMLLVPLKDGNESHLGSIWGGNAFGFERYGLRYFPTESDSIRTWADSSRRFMEITREAGADVYLTIHAHLNKTFDLINALRFRVPGDPHPFVSSKAIENHLTLSTECMEAQLAWRLNQGK